MNYDSINSRIEYSQDIPDSIETGLLSLLGVDSLGQLSPHEMQTLRENVQSLFRTTAETDYYGFSKAYALYYLPLNFYKIWRPLIDLLLTDSLPIKGQILEFGAGPGSATFGLMEFYKCLATDNRSQSFSLEFTIIERNPEFISVFQKLYSIYRSTLPNNFEVLVKFVNDNAFSFLANPSSAQYNLVIESNMLNPNEGIVESRLFNFAVGLKELLAKHSSVVLIEPARKELAASLKLLKKDFLDIGLSCYSPCCCSNERCFQFASGRIDTSRIKLAQQLYNCGIITKKQLFHSYEYAVFRNDRLRKYNYDGSGIGLSKLENRAGELVDFKAFILTALDRDNHFIIKICDGSRPISGDLWLKIPKCSLVDRELNCLTTGRGGMIDVKDAVIVNPTHIGVTQKTRIKIYK